MRVALLALIGSAAISLASPAIGQDTSDNREVCANEDGLPETDAVTACTALIASGALSSDDLAQTYALRGHAYLHLDDGARAVSDFSEAIRLDPQEKYYFIGRATAYADQKDSAHSLADYNEALRLDPNYASGFYGRGLEEIAIGDKAKGDADIARAKAIDPDIDK